MHNLPKKKSEAKTVLRKKLTSIDIVHNIEYEKDS